MNIQVIVDWVFVICCAILIVAPFPPFERKRVRTRWAKVAIVVMGISGVIKGIVCLFVDAHWHDFSDRNRYLIDVLIRFIYDGFSLGIIFMLMISGQFRGTKLLRE